MPEEDDIAAATCINILATVAIFTTLYAVKKRKPSCWVRGYLILVQPVAHPGCYLGGAKHTMTYPQLSIS